jgi:hypothetical protein
MSYEAGICRTSCRPTAVRLLSDLRANTRDSSIAVGGVLLSDRLLSDASLPDPGSPERSPTGSAAEPDVRSGCLLPRTIRRVRRRNR